MTLQALDKPVLYLLMAVGLIMTLSGLYLMFKRKDDENAARIELFGLKFQSSSAGTLVLLIGAAFLIIPLFAPKSPNIKTVESEQSTASTLPQAITPKTKNQNMTGQQAVLLPASADALESEPNDQITESNQFRLGFGVKGSLDRDRDDNSDWYVVDVSESGVADFTIKIRTPGGYCNVIAYDQNEEEIDRTDCNASGGSKNFDVFAKDNDVLFFKVSHNTSYSSSVGYELFISAK